MASHCPEILCETCARCIGFNVGVYGNISARCQRYSKDAVWTVPKNQCEFYEKASKAPKCPEVICKTCIRFRGFNVQEFGIYTRCRLHTGDITEWIDPKNRCEYYEEDF